MKIKSSGDIAADKVTSDDSIEMINDLLCCHMFLDDCDVMSGGGVAARPVNGDAGAAVILVTLP